MKKKQKDLSEGLWFLTRLLLGISPIPLIIILGALYLLPIYFLIGIVLMMIFRSKNLLNKSKWIADLLGFIAMWPIFVLFQNEINKPKRKSVLDEFNDLVDNIPALKIQKEYFSAMNIEGTTEDVIPNGIGRFGFDATNPIPTNNIFGSSAYLSKLIDKTGNPINYDRLGSTSANNISKPIDIYEISDSNGKELGTVYISPYQKTISNKAPEGFTILGQNTDIITQKIENEEYIAKNDLAKILLIDDDETLIRLLKDKLEEENFEVNYSLDGINGLISIKINKYDLVVLGLRMPGLQGEEVLDRIKKIDPSIPVIILTGVKDPVVIQNCLNKGAADYIKKPFDYEDLLETIIKNIKENTRINC